MLSFFYSIIFIFFNVIFHIYDHISCYQIKLSNFFYKWLGDPRLVVVTLIGSGRFLFLGIGNILIIYIIHNQVHKKPAGAYWMVGQRANRGQWFKELMYFVRRLIQTERNNHYYLNGM